MKTSCCEEKLLLKKVSTSKIHLVDLRQILIVPSSFDLSQTFTCAEICQRFEIKSRGYLYFSYLTTKFVYVYINFETFSTEGRQLVHNDTRASHLGDTMVMTMFFRDKKLAGECSRHNGRRTDTYNTCLVEATTLVIMTAEKISRS